MVFLHFTQRCIQSREKKWFYIFFMTSKEKEIRGYNTTKQ